MSQAATNCLIRQEEINSKNLISAVRSGDERECRSLLNLKGINVHKRDYSGFTPILLACSAPMVKGDFYNMPSCYYLMGRILMIKVIMVLVL